MMSLLLMWFLFVQFNASPLWLGAGVAMTFFYGRSAYQQWQDQRLMSQLVALTAAEMAKKPSQTSQEPPGDDFSGKQG